ncbi:Hypothetical predicted protein [Mytilus galloprovincialis]|uniref:C-type lectin domain-containing protein n=1 Tax=Mytilus galloprovincialis TaxID=29158 RepID=A0A8B6HLU1_MYTGA|nr:Hypothetical predicted protein [Mytilus galloprovincialis]
MFVTALVFLGLVVAESSAQRVQYDIKTQATCTQVERGATRDCRWVAGLDMADLVIEKGRIIAYQIKWFSGKWSHWYVPGLNDISDTYNPKGRSCALSYRDNSMRRRWAVFYDHRHKFIICKPQ